MKSRFKPWKEYISAYLVGMAARSVGVNNSTIPVNIADIKEFSVLESVLPTSHIIGCHIVEFTEFPCQFNMSFIGQVSTADDDNAVLYAIVVVTWTIKLCVGVLEYLGAVVSKKTKRSHQVHHRGN